MPTANRGNGGNVPTRARLSLKAKKLVKDMLSELTSDPDLTTEDDADPAPGAGDDNHQHIHIHMNGEGGAPAVKPGSTDDDADPTPGATDMESRVTGLEKSVAEILAIVKKQGGATGDGDPPPVPPAKKDDEPPVPPNKTEDGDDDDDDDDGKKSATMDSVALETSFKSLQAQCEILIPGFRTPTFDAKQKRRFTVDMMCATRRKVLDTLYTTADGQQIVDSVAESAGNLDITALPCAKVATIFNSAAGAKKLLNNRAATADANRAPAAGTQPQIKSNVPGSMGELNAMLNKHYANKA